MAIAKRRILVDDNGKEYRIGVHGRKILVEDDKYRPRILTVADLNRMNPDDDYSTDGELSEQGSPQLYTDRSVLPAAVPLMASAPAPLTLQTAPPFSLSGTETFGPHAIWPPFTDNLSQPSSSAVPRSILPPPRNAHQHLTSAPPPSQPASSASHVLKPLSKTPAKPVPTRPQTSAANLAVPAIGDASHQKHT